MVSLINGFSNANPFQTLSEKKKWRGNIIKVPKFSNHHPDQSAVINFKVRPSTSKKNTTCWGLRWWLVLFSNEVFLNKAMYIFLDIMLLYTSSSTVVQTWLLHALGNQKFVYSFTVVICFIEVVWNWTPSILNVCQQFLKCLIWIKS